jgi:tyrosinase
MSWNPSAKAETTLYIRQEINDFMKSPEKVEALRRGVRVMEERSLKNPDDPTGWLVQANIHGLPTKKAVSEPLATCQHGSFYFLPWHRAYLYYFERILRDASGDPTLTLPYWNYSASNNRTLPDPFRNPNKMCKTWQQDEDCNPLYVSNTHRKAGVNSPTNPTPLPDFVVSYATAFSYKNFDNSPETPPVDIASPSFGGQILSEPKHLAMPHGQLEHQPHDLVHNQIGSGIASNPDTCSGSWMGNPNCAGRDPIFWVHHANIDRLWTNWLALGDGRANPTDENWRNTPFSFYNEKGQLEKRPVSDFLDTKALGYIYSDDPSLAETMNAPRQQSVDLRGRRANVPIPLPLKRNQLFTAAFGANQSRSPVLILEGVTYDPGAPIYKIYINLPPGAEANTQKPYYVGAISLFAYPQGETFKFDISDELQGLLEQERISGNEISVQFVPEGENELEALRAASEPIASIHVERVRFDLE